MKKRNYAGYGLAALLSAVVAAEDIKLPRWEAGIGVGALTMPDYVGSDTQHGYLLPLPYFVYRGDYVKADRNGLRGELFDNGAIDIQLSLAAAAPVRSRDDQARAGMSNLDPTVELGPQLRWHAWKPSPDSQLDLRVPLRWVYSVNRHGVHAVGATFSPSLNLDVRHAFSGWNVGLNAGPVFGSHAYDNYYYGVAPQYQTTTRTAYDARAGYNGLQFTSALSRRISKWWMGGYVRYNSLAGAVIQDSPLVRRKSGISAGLGFAYVFAQSSETVSSPLDN